METKHTLYRIGEMKMNDGAVPLMSGEGEETVRIALIDCQSKFKRGEGWKSECPIQDANAAFIVRACNSHDALVKKLLEAVRHIEYYCAPTTGPIAEFCKEAKALAAAGVKVGG